jgi:hypothetical protein
MADKNTSARKKTHPQIEVIARPSQLSDADAAERTAELLRRLTYFRDADEQSGHRFLDNEGRPLPTLREEGFIFDE